jgi:putative YpdA family bacillithiol system oxidoreductase
MDVFDTQMLLVSAFVGGPIALTAGTATYLRRRAKKRHAKAWTDAVREGRHEPATLYPLTDPNKCIRCYSCVMACPEGEVLGIVDGSSRLIRGSDCIGHGRCARECPVGAIKLVVGTSARGVDLPEVDENFESSRPGVHVVGELGGMGLIHNAVRQGLALADHLATRLQRDWEGKSVQVAIVGAGPAGLATAVGLHAAGISYRLLEQSNVGGTICSYPRNKVVMTERVKLPLFGGFGRKVMRKEDLLDQVRKLVSTVPLRVEEGVRVLSIDGQDGFFTVLTSNGPVEARKVVLATGRQGTPRHLKVPGEELPKVAYSLVDPEQYVGTRVLVVGGGNSALEAAIELAEQPRTSVTLSYRGDSFWRCREANRTHLDSLVKKGRVTLALKTKVAEIRNDKVVLEENDQRREVGNDFVLACLGGELPLEFLQKAGVALKRYHGTELESAKGPADPADPSEERAVVRPGFAYLVLGGLFAAALLSMGMEYYLLPDAERALSPLHDRLRPVSPWGHGLGIVAGGFMLSSFLYSLRKRWRPLKGIATMRSWLTFHLFTGSMAALFVLFHAAFRYQSQLAGASLITLLAVALSGVIGRYLYGMVRPWDEDSAQVYHPEPAARGRLEELAAAADSGSVPLRAILERAFAPLSRTSFSLRTAFSELRLRRRLLRDLRRVRWAFRNPWDYERFESGLQDVMFQRSGAFVPLAAKRLLSSWRVVHVALAIWLVLAVAAHVAFAWFLGYRWILK